MKETPFSFFEAIPGCFVLLRKNGGMQQAPLYYGPPDDRVYARVGSQHILLYANGDTSLNNTTWISMSPAAQNRYVKQAMFVKLTRPIDESGTPAA